MRVVAIIQEPAELRKIMAWAAEKAEVPQELLPVGSGPPGLA
jgi:hypothetical protein